MMNINFASIAFIFLYVLMISA